MFNNIRRAWIVAFVLAAGFETSLAVGLAVGLEDVAVEFLVVGIADTRSIDNVEIFVHCTAVASAFKRIS